MSRTLLQRLAAGPAVLAIAVVAAACSSGGRPTVVPTATPEPPMDLSSLQTNVRLAEMWGHLETSAASATAGNEEDAVLHSAHPIAEYWPLVSGKLEELGHAGDLRTALDAYQEAVQSEKGVSAAAIDVRAAILEAMLAVSDSQLNRPEYRAAIARDLLESMESEFEESVEGGSLSNLPEYQDAWGFLRVAVNLYDPISDDISSKDSSASNSIDADFRALEGIFVELRPTDAPGSLEDVEHAVDGIRGQLAVVFDLAPDQGSTPKQIVDQINELLGKAITDYNAGNNDEAYESAANAYLEGFENIEGDLIRANRRDLVEDLELKFKAFRDAVRDMADATSLEQLKTDIESGLQQALEALG